MKAALYYNLSSAGNPYDRQKQLLKVKIVDQKGFKPVIIYVDAKEQPNNALFEQCLKDFQDGLFDALIII